MKKTLMQYPVTKMRKTKYFYLVLISVMASLSLGLYALESLIPPIIAVPGVKLGLANVITLVCIYIIGTKNALAVLLLRIFLSAIIFGQPVSLTFSLFGGLLSFFAMAVLKRLLCEENIWAISVFGAFFHNLGQIIAAVIITGEITVAYYFLILIISSVITGVFTGICAEYAVKKLKKLNFRV